MYRVPEKKRGFFPLSHLQHAVWLVIALSGWVVAGVFFYYDFGHHQLQVDQINQEEWARMSALMESEAVQERIQAQREMYPPRRSTYYASGGRRRDWDRGRDRARGRDSTPSQDGDSRQEARIDPHAFDPNRVSQEELEGMGLTERQAQGFIRHRESKLEFGYIFRNEEEFRENKNIPDHVDDILAPYLLFENPLRPFDPNTVTAEELMAFGLGISRKRAASFIKYRRTMHERGRRFRTKAEFMKVGAISPEQDAQLETYISFETEAQPQTNAPEPENETN